MATIRIKRSNTASATPSSLQDGEIAINQADGKLWYRTSAGGVASFAAGVTDGSKGDITVSGSTWTINANAVVTADIAGSAVTYAKIQNVSATDRLLGRSTSGAGVVEEIACTAFGRSVIAGADAAAVRTTLGLGTAATSASTSFAASSHVHGNLTNAGAIGSTSGLPIITTTAGVLTAGAFGTAAGSFCQGNDSRLSDSRTPTAHTHALSDLTQSGATSGQVATWNGTSWAPAAAAAAGGVTDGSKGDITVSGSGATWTINANAVVTADIAGSAVTYAKIQNVSATDRLLGRSTAGAGVVEEIACTAAGRALIDDADAAAQRTTLGLGSISTQASSSVAITGGSINGTTIGATTASTGAFTTVSTTGSVGIGTAAPNNLLVVSAADTTNSLTNSSAAITLVCANSAAFGRATNLNFNQGDSAAGQRLATIAGVYTTYSTTVGGSLAFSTADGTGAVPERMRLTAAGNLGIGTTTPASALDVNGVITTSLGSVTAPALTFTGDSNTGVYSPGAGQWAVATDGTQRIVISAAGDVGIGIAAAANTRLYNYHTVANGASTVCHQIFTDPVSTVSGAYANFGAYYIMRTDIASGVTDTGAKRAMFASTLRNNKGASGTDGGTASTVRGLELQYGHQSQNTALTPTTTQAVGILLSPCAGLGTIGVLYDLYIGGYATTGGTVSDHYAIYQANSVAKNVFFGNVGIGASRTSPASALDVNGVITTAVGSVTAPALTFTGDSDTGIYSPGAGQWAVATDGVQRIYVSAAGNVQVGTGAVSGLRYLDVNNTDTGSSSGSVVRLISANVAGTATAAANLIKYKNGQFSILNAETDAAAFTSFTVGSTECLRVSATTSNFSTSLTVGGSAVILATDARLSDARTPLSHTQAASTITGLAAVATSGSYNDLTNQPTIPTFGRFLALC